ncbi:carboxymuconolactone decarboxylase family protein [Streptomyces sp. WMMC500]|uniref:carboxymuconolactone decarboxylase family protein n=1 Tax=Streptomyces sp. WMMC500 TaxID=3015154 RepID=UPI00248C6CBB|nr:carboxymuconolactone decarboxylase family protein [Streptomyces sp. WMMC500]WBB58714.1 carboxymuconolactone decarboxylase family protein [Streptomyces sp. WMMC500]
MTIPQDKPARRRSLLRYGAAGGAGAMTASLPAGGQAAAHDGSSRRYARGVARMRQIAGPDALDTVTALDDVAPDLGRFVVEFAYGDVHARPGLDARQRQLVTVGALTATGDTASQLRFHIAAALHTGLAPEQIVEALIHLVPFTGFPRTLNALTAARAVFEERHEHIAPVEVPAGGDRYGRGAEMLRAVDGAHGLEVIESLKDVAPDLGRYIVEFTFGDVYPRPGLDLPQRQLVTLGGLIAFGDTAPQQRVHVNAALNVGLSPRQVIETVIQTVPYAGFPRALNAVGVVREVFGERGVSA